MKVYDTWELNTLRAAAEYNAANPDPEFAGAELWVKDQLAQAEAQLLHPDAKPVADEEPASRRPGTGHSNYGGQVSTGASDAQVKFITSLAKERGYSDEKLATLLASIKDRRAASKVIDELKAQKPEAVVRPATEGQLKFLQDLLAEREHSFDGDLTGLHFGQASNMIEQLLAAPRVKTAAHGIRHGRYAYQPEGAQAQFYRVAQNGRIYIQAGPAEHPYNGALNEALEAIKADPKTHAALYGHLIGVCGRCSLPLTDEVSRAQGLGPICVNKTDW